METISANGLAVSDLSSISLNYILSRRHSRVTEDKSFVLSNKDMQINILYSFIATMQTMEIGQNGLMGWLVQI